MLKRGVVFSLLAFLAISLCLVKTASSEEVKPTPVDGTLIFGITPKTGDGAGASEEKKTDKGEKAEGKTASETEGTDSEFSDEFVEEDEYAEETPDPYENFNRAMFRFNDFMYENAMEPIATVYTEITDPDFRSIVTSFFKNIAMPVRLVSTVIQGDGDKAGRVLTRFFINSTLGIGGMVDVAKSEFDMGEVEEDFDQALGSHDVKTGAYVVWPFFGPNTIRGTVGKAVDGVLDPSWMLTPGLGADFGMGAGKKVNEIAEQLGIKEEIDDMAIDPYLSVRDLYLQYQRGKLKE